MSESNLRFLGAVPPNLVASLLWSAEEVAQRALQAVAADERLLSGFLARTGLAPDAARLPPRSGDVLLAVLDHVTADEAGLLDVARRMGCPPSVLVRAREALGPRPEPAEEQAGRPLTAFCKGCGAQRRLDRAAAAGVPARVVMIETPTCERCDPDAGAQAPATWLDARGREVEAGR